ncbi:MAG TPA: hypothetical protein VLG11_01605 [Candidatus Saccharimonadales bacterium]|nr:hypothetical protein [Candidatus Saccharimonadales bacterium]
MDNNSAELARAGLGAFADVLSPQFREIREQLAAQLAGHSTLEGLRNAELSGRANFEMISQFVEQLPTADENGFLADDMYTARQLQANTIWLKMRNEASRRWTAILNTPYYIIGQRLLPPARETYSKPTVQLLLFGATAGERGIRELTLWDDQYAIVENEAQRLAASDACDPETLRSMFDQDAMKLRVSAVNSPRRTYLARNDMLVRGQGAALFVRDYAKYVARYGLDVKLSREKLETTRLDDAKLAEFDVMTRLDLLAVTFGKVNELDGLLETYNTSELQASTPPSALEG